MPKLQLELELGEGPLPLALTLPGRTRTDISQQAKWRREFRLLPGDFTYVNEHGHGSFNEGSLDDATRCLGPSKLQLEPIVSEVSFSVDGKGEEFRVLRKIGEGGFGQVFHVLRVADRKHYALKRVRRTTCGDQTPQEADRRMKKEAAIMRKLKHSNIVKFLHLVEESGVSSILMELGVRPVANPGDLDWMVSKHVGEQGPVASALRHMHCKGVGHGDIKPENLIVFFPGCVKITDFGSAGDLFGELSSYTEFFAHTHVKKGMLRRSPQND